MAKPGQLRALTREAAWKAKQMYEERDGRGRRKHTIMEIADFLGVGETTAYRAIRAIGPYMTLPEVKTEEQLSADAAESLIKLQRLLAETPEGKEQREYPMPELPKGNREGLSATERMQQAARELREKEQQGDKLLSELTGDKHD